MKRLTCALALAASSLAFCGLSLAARAAPPVIQGPLQLNIITPDPASISDKVYLDVSFRGSTVQSVQLYLDDKPVAQRKLNTQETHGVITFTLDREVMTQGNHSVKVVAVGPNGAMTKAVGTLTIPAMDFSAPIRIGFPRPGTEVGGTVPVRVNLDGGLQGQKPYITFFVDKEFKTLRNYPPYQFDWDTTKVQNGWHVVEAWAQTEDALTPTKAVPVRINVNNAAGDTQRQNGIEDLRGKFGTGDPATDRLGSPITSALPTLPGPRPGRVIAPSPLPLVQLPVYKTGTRHTVVPDPNGPARGVTAGPGLLHPGAPSLTVGTNSPLVVGPISILSPGTTRQNSSALSGSGRSANNGSRSPVLPGFSPASPNPPVIIALQPGSTTVMPVGRGSSLGVLARNTVTSGADSARLGTVSSSSHLSMGSAIVVPHGGAFDVAFNGTMLHFDVQPRVDHGVAIAPIRQIFEHTGGRLYWFGGKAKTVRAVNSTREIEIKVGNRTAVVNNEKLTMERTPFIERGRTIVPLTFIRSAMDVYVHYDVQSGRLLIESR